LNNYGCELHLQLQPMFNIVKLYFRTKKDY